MNLLLDVVASGSDFSEYYILLGFFLMWGFIEGLVIYFLKINTFWRSVLHAVLVNLASFVAGFFILAAVRHTELDFKGLNGTVEKLPIWIGLWALTVIIEGLLLKLLNNSISWGKIFKASIIMNLITYAILYFIAFQR